MPVKLSRISAIDSDQLIVAQFIHSQFLLGCPQFFLPYDLAMLEILIRDRLLHTLGAQLFQSQPVLLLSEQIACEFVLFLRSHQLFIVLQHSDILNVRLAISSCHFLRIKVTKSFDLLLLSPFLQYFFLCFLMGSMGERSLKFLPEMCSVQIGNDLFLSCFLAFSNELSFKIL